MSGRAELRNHFDEAQLVELTHHIALENMRGRVNMAFGVGAAGFSEGMVCAVPDTVERRRRHVDHAVPRGAGGSERQTARSAAVHRDEGGKMAAIVESIEISCPPGDVFSYATGFAHFPQWQGRVVSARPEDDAPLAVGSKAVVTRRVGPRELRGTEEITQLDPPRAWQVRGAGAIPVIAVATGTIEPLDGGDRSLATIALEFEGHGIGKLLAPLIRSQSRKQLPKDEQRLKELLEPGG
jgi:uncharacterized protein YndB with AHSA1/START domain